MHISFSIYIYIDIYIGINNNAQMHQLRMIYCINIFFNISIE